MKITVAINDDADTKIIECLKSAANNPTLRSEEHFAILVALEVYEKVMPKKPSNVFTDRLILMDLENKSVKRTLGGNCPTCGKAVHSLDEFCKNCGQALDWDNEKAQKIVGASFPTYDEVSNAKESEKMYRKINGKTLTLVRLDEKTKKEMKQICDELGLTLNDAFTIFAKKFCRERGIPFEVSVASSRPIVNVRQSSEQKPHNSENFFPTFDGCVGDSVGDEISSKTYETTEQGELVLPQEAMAFETVDGDKDVDLFPTTKDSSTDNEINDDCTDNNANDEVDTEIHDSNKTTAIDDDLWEKISEAFNINNFKKRGSVN